jgi:hypothetical protein
MRFARDGSLRARQRLAPLCCTLPTRAISIHDHSVGMCVFASAA